MAKRPVFLVSTSVPFFTDIQVEFEYHNGFALTQKQKSIRSLHAAFIKDYAPKKVLEISSKSENELGIKLSAFNLLITTKEQREYSVEVAFQASKVFENGGPYKDMLDMPPRDAKRDPRLKNSGRLLYFNFGNRKFELNPTTYFYNWLYINTLHLHPELAEPLLHYDAFTDIVFNPERSINCQARSSAVYVSLQRKGILLDALKDKDFFLDAVYGKNFADMPEPEQLNLWNKF